MYNNVMIKNNYGQPVYTEENLFDFYMRTPDLTLKNIKAEANIRGGGYQWKNLMKTIV